MMKRKKMIFALVVALTCFCTWASMASAYGNTNSGAGSYAYGQHASAGTTAYSSGPMTRAYGESSAQGSYAESGAEAYAHSGNLGANSESAASGMDTDTFSYAYADDIVAASVSSAYGWGEDGVSVYTSAGVEGVDGQGASGSVADGYNAGSVSIASGHI